VTVSEDAGKNTITLGGTLHSDEAKTRAANVAQASARPRIIANEISVEPVGNEGESRKMESNLDDGIESNFKAVLISKGLDKQHIRYNAKNGVLTLKGSVKSSTQRQQAQELAKNTPNVQQVVNELQVER
jgi:hyperosmotically inducible protein